MGEASPALQTITSRETHDAAIEKAHGKLPECTNGVPTVIFVTSSSLPACQAVQPKVEALAQANPGVSVYMMEMTAETTPMIKFGPWNAPIFIFMKEKYCETVLGGRDWAKIEEIVKTKLGGGSGA